MTFLIERLTELRRHLQHLRELSPRVREKGDLLKDLSLHNDVLFSLLTVCQLLIDIAGELSSRKGLRFADYTEAVTNLEAYDEFSAELVRELRPLPGFRNVLLHEYVQLDLNLVVEALQKLEPLDELAAGLEGLLPDLQG